MSEAQSTTNHEQIRRWAEKRKGHPATVKGTHAGEEAGLLRIDFEDGGSDESLERLDWDAFFDKFEEKELAFLYQDQTDDGSTSRFCKFVERDSV